MVEPNQFLSTLGGDGGYYYDDYDYQEDYQLDYHRPRDREIALQLQAKAVENQGNCKNKLFYFQDDHLCK